MASSGGMTNTSVGQRHDSMHSIYYYKIDAAINVSRISQYGFLPFASGFAASLFLWLDINDFPTIIISKAMFGFHS